MRDFSRAVYNEDDQRHDKFGVLTLLDTGHLPIEDLTVLVLREGRRPHPIYQVHR